MGGRRRSGARQRKRTMEEQGAAGNGHFMKRISKSLYYGKLPTIPCLSLPVMELSADIFSEPQKGKSLKRLYLEDATELTRNACISPCSLVLALVYLERLKTCNPEYVADMAPSDLFLISLMVSNKFQEDDGEEYSVFADEWAASAGISLTELNQMERDFLTAIDWRVFVSKLQFDTTLHWLENQIAQKQGKQRGWFTYTDLANISHSGDYIGLVKCLTTVYAALSISYVASVSAIIASSILTTHSLAVFSMSSTMVGNMFHSTADTNRTNFPVDLQPRSDYDLDRGTFEVDVTRFSSDDDVNNTKHEVVSDQQKLLMDILDFVTSLTSTHRTHILSKVLKFLDQKNTYKVGFGNFDNFYNNGSTCCESIYRPAYVHLWSLPVTC